MFFKLSIQHTSKLYINTNPKRKLPLRALPIPKME